MESKADVVVCSVAVGFRERMWGGIRPEHCKALEPLNGLLAGKTEFYGVEVTLESELVVGRVPLESIPLLAKLTVVVRPNPPV